MAKERDLKYKAFSMKLADETKELLMQEQKKSGVSWNLFVIILLKKYESERIG